MKNLFEWIVSLCGCLKEQSLFSRKSEIEMQKNEGIHIMNIDLVSSADVCVIDAIHEDHECRSSNSSIVIE